MPHFFFPRRLDKFVRDSTALSVADIQSAWRSGRIKVRRSRCSGPCNCPRNAHPATQQLAIEELTTRIFAEDSVWVDGKLVLPRQTTHVAMLHKPARVTSTARDPQGKADLQPWLRQLPPGMFPIGRLDRDTTGLLLFTDDGDLANALLRPSHHALKRYWLWLDEDIPPDDPRLLAMVQPNSLFSCVDEAHCHHQSIAGTELHLTLSEGKNRQIRRLCFALKLHLVHLHRFSLGALTLGELPSGKLRSLNNDEVDSLWLAAGGRSHIEQAQLAALYREAADSRASGSPHLRLEAFLSPFDLPRKALPSTTALCSLS